MSKKKVAFIGLGAMGKPMAKNLIKAGYPLAVYDLKPAPVKELADLGARAAQNCADAANGADTIILILQADPHVKEAVLGKNGVLHGAKKGATLMDMTSLSPHTSKLVAAEAAKVGLKFLDAPVSGGNIGAEKGTLTIMVGCEKEVLEEQRDLLEVMGKTIFHVGGVGMGETVKMANQILVAAHTAAIVEAFVLAVKLGADPQVVFDVLKKSAGCSWILENRFPNYILPHNFTQPGFAMDLLRKDVGLALESAKLEKVPTPLVSQVFEILTMASATGRGQLDYSAMVEMFEEWANVKVQAS
jgi:2-hydroxymethylglutarate dehydrogenase